MRMSWMFRQGGLGIFGLILTALYLTLLWLGIPMLRQKGWVNSEPLKLSELGDFLAGCFAPIAFFWLILGFFQQGRELRYSAESLRLQTEELVKSVEAQRDLASTTQKELSLLELAHKQEADLRNLSLAAEFIVTADPAVIDAPIVARVRLKNKGRTASRLQIVAHSLREADLYVSFFEKSFIEAEKELLLEVEDRESATKADGGMFALYVRSTSTSGIQRTQKFHILGTAVTAAEDEILQRP